MQIQIQVLLTRDGDWWVARGLNKDVAAQARDINDAVYEFQRVLMSHIALDLIQGRDPLEDVPPAPRKYFAMWESGLSAVRQPPSFTIPETPLPPVQYDLRVA